MPGAIYLYPSASFACASRFCYSGLGRCSRMPLPFQLWASGSGRRLRKGGRCNAALEPKWQALREDCPESMKETAC
eukprot:3052573-Pyramimonas_sp.AAC.1